MVISCLDKASFQETNISGSFAAAPHPSIQFYISKPTDRESQFSDILKQTMAAKLTSSSSSSSLNFKNSFLPNSSSLPSVFNNLASPKARILHFKLHAKLGGGDETKKGGKKRFITREEEPEQYWQTAGEREGENPMKTPIPYIIIFGMATPFVILAIAFANGWVKVPVR